MAQSLRCPPVYLLRSPKSLHHPPRCLRSRQFSSARLLRYASERDVARTMKTLAQLQSAQSANQNPSPKAVMRMEQSRITSDKMPRDLGLLPETFIPPSRDNLSSILTIQGWRERSALLKTHLKRLGENLYSQYHYKYRIYPQERKLRPKLRRPRITPIAKDLYTQIYAAFARGSRADRALLDARCCESLRDDFVRRLARRSASPAAVMRWRLDKWLARPKVVSHRAGPLGFKVEGAEVGCRQVVVRLLTRQSIQVGRLKAAAARKARDGGVEGKEWADEDVVWEDPVVRDAREHMVIQRRLIKGVETAWEVWGFAAETSVGQIMGLSEEEDQERLRRARAGKAALEEGEMPAGTV